MEQRTTEADVSEGEDEPKGIRFSEKQLKLVAVVLVVVAVLAIALWGMVPEEIHEVNQVTSDPADYIGEEVNVKGVVADWDINNKTFSLCDSLDLTCSFMVTYDGAPPEGFADNVTAVVHGVVTQGAGGLVIESESITIGCPSKY